MSNYSQNTLNNIIENNNINIENNNNKKNKKFNKKIKDKTNNNPNDNNEIIENSKNNPNNNKQNKNKNKVKKLKNNGDNQSNENNNNRGNNNNNDKINSQNNNPNDNNEIIENSNNNPNNNKQNKNKVKKLNNNGDNQSNNDNNNNNNNNRGNNNNNDKINTQNNKKQKNQTKNLMYAIQQSNGLSQSTLGQINTESSLCQPLQQIQCQSENLQEMIDKSKKTRKEAAKVKEDIWESIDILSAQMEKSITEMSDEEKQEMNTMVQDILQKNKEFVNQISSYFETNNVEEIITEMEKQKTQLTTFNHFAKAKIETLTKQKQNLKNSQQELNEKINTKINEVEGILKNTITKIANLRKEQSNLLEQKKNQMHSLYSESGNIQKVQIKIQLNQLKKLQPEIERQVFQSYIDNKLDSYKNYLYTLQAEECHIESQISLAKSDSQQFQADKEKLFTKEENKKPDYYQKISILRNINPYAKEYFHNNTLHSDLKRIRGEKHKVEKIVEYLKKYFDNSKYLQKLQESNVKYQARIQQIYAKQNKIQSYIDRTTQLIQEKAIKIQKKIQQRKNRTEQLKTKKEIFEKQNLKFQHRLDKITNEIESIPNLMVTSQFLEHTQNAIQNLILMSEEQRKTKMLLKEQQSTLEILQNDLEEQADNLSSAPTKRKANKYSNTLELLLHEIQQNSDQLENQMKEITSYQVQQITD